MTQPIELDHEADTEQYDEIPWSHLVQDLGKPGPSLPVVAGIVLVVGAAIGFIAAIVFGGDDPAAATSVTSIVPTSTVESVVVEPPPVTTVAAPPATTSPEVLFSEADLMAVATDHEVRAAVARAEWFVRDFFTIDGSSGTSLQVAALLDGYAPRPDAVTYVEWARALLVDPTGPGQYDVTVAFQALAAEGDVFVRHPVRAVRLPVLVGPDLATAAAGLPRPASVETTAIEQPVVVDQTPPMAIVDEATAMALRFGADPLMARSWLDDGTWHIVMSVQYAGAAWPLQIDISQPGSPP